MYLFVDKSFQNQEGYVIRIEAGDGGLLLVFFSNGRGLK